LYDKYHNDGFEMALFPTNQFGGQAPGTSKEEREWAWKKLGFEADVYVSMAGGLVVGGTLDTVLGRLGGGSVCLGGVPGGVPGASSFVLVGRVRVEVCETRA
jgi:hypothetical protein